MKSHSDVMTIQKSTPDKPEIVAMAADLGLDPDAVFGKLFRVWAWFDNHTNGHAPYVTADFVDQYAGVSGFGQSMVAVGWLLEESGGLTMPSFERFCSKKVSPKKKPAKEKAFESDLPEILDDQRFRTVLGAWLEYKGNSYKPRGLQALLSRARNLAEENGIEAVCKMFERALANGWKGWDFPFGSATKKPVNEPRLAANLLDES